MKLLSVLALVLFVGANSFAQTGTTGAAGTQQAAPAATTTTTTEAPAASKPMKKKMHKAKHSKKAKAE
ncbi:MAG: hypothetical protein H7333_00585 [Bdellovibrionales bacterium]|nr:hypothetical protein [Oligoflexia bacterium]